MKIALVLIVLFALLASPILGPSRAEGLHNQAFSSTQAQATSIELLSKDSAGGMPGRPLPARPIPRHEPGEPFRGAHVTHQVTRLNSEGVEEAVELTGLDALLANGTMSDPLQGNYRLVDLDKIMVGLQADLLTFSAISGTVGVDPEVITGSQVVQPFNLFGVAAADLNLDGVDEQISAWLDSDDIGNRTINLGIGEMPGSLGQTTTAPAAVAHNDGSGDLLVRGYDQSLWHRHYDGSTWGEWDNAAGGLLLSAPAVASPGDGSFDVFAIGTDHLTYRRSWDGVAWSTDWELVDDPGYWDSLGAMPSQVWPIPEDVDSPAAVARPGTNQMDLFRRGPDNSLHWRHFNGSAWEAWVSLGGVITSAPSAVSFGLNHIRLFARGVDQQIWLLPYDGGWGRWWPLPKLEDVRSEAAPTAVGQPGTSMIDVYVCGSDGALWQISLDGNDWGAWSDALGGSMASGVGAAAWAGGRELFAQEADGSLQHNRFDGSTWSGWQNWGGLIGCCQETDLNVDAAHYPGLALATGYFSGDGRPQILVASVDSGWLLSIHLYDVADGFRPVLRASVTLTVPYADLGDFVKITTGDLDGDGTDEIALLYRSWWDLSTYKVRVLDVIVDPEGDWEITSTGMQSKTIAPLPASTISLISDFDIAKGDFDGNGDAELVIATLFQVSHYPTTFTGYQRTIQILDVPDLDDVQEVYYENSLWDTVWVFTHHDCRGGIELEAGNLDGNPENGDEIVNTVMVWDDAPPRRMYVYKASPDTPTWMLEQKALLDWGAYPAGEHMVFDGLVLGDFDRNMQDEIVFLYGSEKAPNHKLNLDVLQYTADDDEDTGLAIYGHYQTPWEYWYSYSSLAAGSFTGESLRVGAPTYRLQRKVGDILAVINQPPKHKDVLNGVTHDVNSTDASTYAAYENEQSQSTQMSLEVTRDWGFASGLEVGFGNPTGTHVKTSFDRSYGAHFEKTTTAFTEVTFGSEVKAVSDDILFYSGKNLQLWEYPVYKDNDRTPDGRIMVVFPEPLAGNTGTQKFYSAGNNTCDFWYAPEHQLNNVWSYAKELDQLPGYDPQKGILNTGDSWTVGGNEGNFYTNWTDQTVTQQANSLNQSVESLYEAQIGGDKIDVSAKIFGFGVSYSVFTPYIKGTFQSSYASGALSTHTVAGSDATAVHVNFGAIDPSGIYNYEVTPYLYWATDGYLALDYLTNPLSSSFWDSYNRPDPAFVLPWADGHCTGKDLFSKDIAINPPFAANGETVAITATVHNFSNVGADDVRVRFCLGAPEAGCAQIGPDQTIDLPPRGRVDVSTTWEASGAGLKRIYAVIDPMGEITEMHDETRNSEMNNNIAFGQMQMGDSGYVDPGGEQYFPYQFLAYTDDQGQPLTGYGPTEALTETVRAFVPTATISETVRYELTPMQPFLAEEGQVARWGIILNAYLGGSQRDEPTRLSFSPAPAAIQMRYSDADIVGLNENNLILYTYDSDQDKWVDAACGPYQRYPEENWMLVPVCQTGSFALLGPGSMLYLPLLSGR